MGELVGVRLEAAVGTPNHRVRQRRHRHVPHGEQEADTDMVFAITTAGPNNLWEYNPISATGWLDLSAGDFQQISAGRNAAGQAVVYGVLVDQSLYEYNPDPAFFPAAGHLLQLSAPGTILSVSAGGPDEVFAITTAEGASTRTTCGSTRPRPASRKVGRHVLLDQRHPDGERTRRRLRRAD